MAELKPCPFCGGRAFIHKSNTPLGTFYFAHCGNEDCPIEPKTHSKYKREHAVEAWNRRVEDGK